MPFLLSSVAFDRATRSFGFFRAHYAPIQLAAGAVLVGMGLLVLTGELFRLNVRVREFLDGLGLNVFKSV